MFLSTFKIVKSLGSDLGLKSSDVRYICTRILNEGTKFLTSTLPKLCKCVLWSFTVGYFDRGNPLFGLTCFAWKGRSLRNFRSLLDKLFCPKTGKLLADADATAVHNLRVLCEYLYKLCLPFSEEDLWSAAGSYGLFEADYPQPANPQATRLQLEEMRWALVRFYPEIARASADDILRECHPRYGPGSLNLIDLQEHGGDRQTYWEYKELPVRSTGLAPKRLAGVSGFLKPYPGYRLSTKDHLVKPEVRRICEVLFVPKNADGPRVISRENPFDIRLQMAYFDWSASLYERVTRGRVQFRDQEVSRETARIGSLTGETITADMKEASDRLSYQNASFVFQDCPGVMWFFRNTRSTHALLPKGDILPLRKLAGMGSGLTFPTMAMMIYLAATVGVIRELYPGANHIKNVPGVDRLWRTISSDILVYGDDFACSKKYAHGALAGIERAGFKINVHKTFLSGPFRESCGGDYFNGVDVTPPRLKLMGCDLELSCNVINPGVNFLDPFQDGYVLERHCRELVKRGMVTLADYYYCVLERVYGKFPYVSGESPYLGRYVVGGTPPQRSTKAWYPIPRIETFELADIQTALGRSLRPKSGELYNSKPVALHGEIAVPHQVKLKKQRVGMTELNGELQAPIVLRSAKNWQPEEIRMLKFAYNFQGTCNYLARLGLPLEVAQPLSFSIS